MPLLIVLLGVGGYYFYRKRKWEQVHPRVGCFVGAEGMPEPDPRHCLCPDFVDPGLAHECSCDEPEAFSRALTGYRASRRHHHHRMPQSMQNDDE
jgi:hypothetical protein